MKFGQRVRELRRAKHLGQRALAEAVGVSFTYISKIENEKLDFGDYPSEEVIVKLAGALEADPDELLILAQKIPPRIRQRVLERPDAFARLAALDDAGLDWLLGQMVEPTAHPQGLANRQIGTAGEMRGNADVRPTAANPSA